MASIANKLTAKGINYIGKRLFGLGKDDDYFGSIETFGNDRRKFSKLKNYKGFVYSCVNLIAEQVASYQPEIYRGDADKKEVVSDHEFLRLLRKPAGSNEKARPITFFDILYATAAFIELQGDCYWYVGKGRLTGRPREIVVLRADKVGRDLDEEGEIKRYYVRKMGGQKIYIEIDEMIPFIGFDPENPYTGKGTTEAAKDYIETDDHATVFTRNFFKNNAGISGVLTISGEVATSAFKKFVRAWRAKYEGVDNAGKVAMLRESDASFTKVGLGLDELDMSALRKMSKDDIATMYRVPMPLLGKAEETGLGRANVETLEYIFAKYTIEPKLKKLDGVLEFALHRYYGDESLRLGHKNIIPADKAHDLLVRDKGTDRWLTRNEIRDEDGKDGIDGGDDLRAPINSVPISSPQPSSDSSSNAAAPTKRIKIKLKKELKKKEVDETGYTPEQKEAFRLELQGNQEGYEEVYAKQFKPILEAQQAEVEEKLETIASSAKEQGIDWFDKKGANNKMLELMTIVLLSLAEQQGPLALLFAGDEDSEFFISETLKQNLTDSTLAMANNFNDETLSKLTDSLNQGMADGEGIGALKQRVSSIYTDASGYRALRIARTETLRASNLATLSAYKQTGYVRAKKWYANPGADELCIYMSEQPAIVLSEDFVPLGGQVEYTDGEGKDQTFTSTYENITVPPIHPNCRCTIIPVR